MFTWGKQQVTQVLALANTPLRKSLPPGKVGRASLGRVIIYLSSSLHSDMVTHMDIHSVDMVTTVTNFP